MNAGAKSGLWMSLLALLIAALPSAAVQAGMVPVTGGARVPVLSFKEARFKGTVKQQYDFSCGSAALATLLSHHYGDPVTEQQVFSAMYEQGDQERIRRKGFSLLDMKRYLQSRGLAADGFRIPLERLEQVQVPAIALTTINGYQHFVVVKGVRGGEVLVGDPALGLKVIGREQFESGWNGIMFLIRDRVEQGRSTFNRRTEWSVRTKAPFGSAFSGPGLASFTLSLPRRADF